MSDTLKQAGIDRFEHLRVTDRGLQNDSTPVNEASMQKVAAKECEVMNGGGV